MFIWSPKEHYALELHCPVHSEIKLKPWQFCKDVSGKSSGKGARLVYDLNGNVIFVQRIYTCGSGRLVHKVMAATPDILASLPQVVQAHFPLIITERSGCTKNLANMIELQLQEGINFLRISEGIANLNMNEFCKRINLYQSVLLSSTDCSETLPITAINDKDWQSILSDLYYSRILVT